MKIIIPAKAMLFGEYGVLEGYPAVVATIPKFSIELEFIKNEEPGVFEIYSSYFPSGKLRIEYNKIKELNSKFYAPENISELKNIPSLKNMFSDKNEAFFYGIFLPYFDVLSTLSIKIKVIKSFSENLGFGTSSALLSGIHMFLFNNFFNKNYFTEEFWKRLRYSLQLTQGGGSGYDCAAQIAASEESYNNKLWCYMWDRDYFIPKINPIHVRGSFGSLISSGIYANTQLAIELFQKSKSKLKWAKKYKDLAIEFLNDPSSEKAKSLMQKAKIIQKQQGTLIAHKQLDERGIPYKSMGAGMGDCYWSFVSLEDCLKINADIVTELTF